MASQYFEDQTSHTTSDACITDTTPPIFAGIAGNTPNLDGSVTVSWVTATDSTTPIEYILYIGAGTLTAGSLFVNSNIVSYVPNTLTSAKIFTLADHTTYLAKDFTYTIGIRAKDGVGNTETNTVVQTFTAIGSGNLPSVYQTVLAALQAENVTFTSNNSTFSTHLSTLSTDLTTLNSYLTTFNTHNTTFATHLSTLNTQLTSLISTASSLATSSSTFSSDLVTFASQLTTFSTYLSTLSTDLTDLEDSATKIQNAATLIITMVI